MKSEESMRTQDNLPDRDGNKQHRPHENDLANQNVTRPAPKDTPQKSEVEKNEAGLENKSVTGPQETTRR